MIDKKRTGRSLIIRKNKYHEVNKEKNTRKTNFYSTKKRFQKCIKAT